MEPILLINGAHGIYLPKIFAQLRFTDSIITPLTDQQLQDLSNVDNEHYLDTWEDVLQGFAIEIDGVTYNLHQDDDLWLVPDGYDFDSAE